jgi:hypothetical protein
MSGKNMPLCLEKHRWYRAARIPIYSSERNSVATLVTTRFTHIALAATVLLAGVAGFVLPAAAAPAPHEECVIDSGSCQDSTAHHAEDTNESEAHSLAPPGHHGECVDCEAEPHCVTCTSSILPSLAGLQGPTETNAIWARQPSPTPLETDPNLLERPPRG